MVIVDGLAWCLSPTCHRLLFVMFQQFINSCYKNGKPADQRLADSFYFKEVNRNLTDKLVYPQFFVFFIEIWHSFVSVFKESTWYDVIKFFFHYLCGERWVYAVLCVWISWSGEDFYMCYFPSMINFSVPPKVKFWESLVPFLIKESYCYRRFWGSNYCCSPDKCIILCLS